MFRVLLVDDEAVIRKGIKNIINWESLGCTVIDEASDGISGMEKIRTLKPDIIVTDIKMPGIDGLDMVKETKELIPHTKIVILTGYRDFEYLQRAIKLGASEYILKPSKIEDITAVIKRVVKELEQWKKSQNEIEELKKSLQEKIPVIKQKLLYDLLFNVNIKHRSISTEMDLCSLKVEKFVLVVIELGGIEESNNYEYDVMYQQGVINSFLDVYSDHFTTEFFVLSERRIVFIVQPTVDMEDISKCARDRLDVLKDVIQSCFKLSIYSVVTEVGEGYQALHEKMKKAIKQLNKESNILHNHIISFDDLKELNKDNEALIKSRISEKNIEEDSMKLILRKAVEYIKNNYCESITLNDVAEYTYVSTFYLSRLFTRELGKGFVDYLNEVRIEKAKEYLRQDNYKAYEVAEMVGIKDAHYFSKLFKKYAGMTPSEYKDKF
ncbi:response regulator transcription factor [Clostridium thermarum]|uniref:response regulator transcription factor n=1 Tax=Clostridium thermarum TaxID=1716543 RepID=UPI0013D16615|nr:response regulator [Clostridium thermarum]